MPVDKAYLLELVALRNECVEYQTRIDIAISPHQTIFAPLEKIATIEENLKFAPVHTQLFRAFLTDLYKKPLFKGKLVSIPDITRSTAGVSVTTVNDLDFRKYAHLFACRILLTQAISTLEAEIATLKSQLDKEETQAKKELDNAVKEKKTEEKDSNQTSLIGQNKQTPTQADAEQKVTAIRDTKKEMLARNKEAFLNYCKHHNIKLDGLDLKTLDTIAFNKSIVRTSEASFFTSMVENNPRLKQKLQKDENLRKLAHGYVNDKADLLKSGRSLRAAGYTINIGDDTAGGTELLTQLNNASKDIQRFGFSQEMVETAFTSSGKDIDDEIKSLQASEDKEAKSRLKELQIAKKYRAEIIKGSYWSDDAKKRDEIWKENELFQDAAIPEELPLSADELPTFLDDRSLLEMMGSQEPAVDENIQTNTPAQTNTPVQPAGEQRQKKEGGISASDIKRAKQVGQIAQKIASNPVAMGAIGVGAGVGISFAAGLSQGLAAAAGAGTIALPAGIAGGAYLGGALGSVFGPLGTVVGAFVGGLGGATVAGLTSLSVNIGGYSIAAQTGHLLYGIPLNTTQLLGGNAATITPTIQATLPALGNLGTATAANAAATLAPTGAGIAQGGAAAAVNGIGNAINVGSKFLAALPNAGTLFTSVGSVGTLVVAPLTATAFVAIMSNSSLMSGFLSNDAGSTTAEGAPLLQIEKSASPSSNVVANTEITYTLKIRSNLESDTGAITDITLTDTFDGDRIDAASVKLSPPSGVTCDKQGIIISCQGIPSLNPSEVVTITYTAKTVSDTTKVAPDGKTPISNTAKVTGKSGEKLLKDETTNTINSDGAAIAMNSMEILKKLKPGWWKFYNYHPDHKNLFNDSYWESQTSSNPGYMSASGGNTLPPCDPGAIASKGAFFSDSAFFYNGSCPSIRSTGPNDMFWCTWGVVYAYAKSGRPLVSTDSPGDYLGVGGMREHFKTESDKFYVANPKVSDIKIGDVAFFAQGDKVNEHVAIVGEITSTTLFTYDSNNYSIRVPYTIDTDGTVLTNGFITLNGVGRLK